MATTQIRPADPAKLGWDTIRTHLTRDGAFSFRWISPEGLLEIKEQTAGLGVEFHAWGGFCNSRDGLHDAIRDTQGRCPPNGAILVAGLST